MTMKVAHDPLALPPGSPDPFTPTEAQDRLREVAPGLMSNVDLDAPIVHLRGDLGGCRTRGKGGGTVAVTEGRKDVTCPDCLAEFRRLDLVLATVRVSTMPEDLAEADRLAAERAEREASEMFAEMAKAEALEPPIYEEDGAMRDARSLMLTVGMGMHSTADIEKVAAAFRLRNRVPGESAAREHIEAGHEGVRDWECPICVALSRSELRDTLLAFFASPTVAACDVLRSAAKGYFGDALHDPDWTDPMPRTSRVSVL